LTGLASVPAAKETRYPEPKVSTVHETTMPEASISVAIPLGSRLNQHHPWRMAAMAMAEAKFLASLS
jgi:hypothetical protein